MVGASLVCASWATTAHAAPFDLAWTAPDGCPSREEMVSATRARLGESETTGPPELFVHGTVGAEKGGFVITFLVAGRPHRPVQRAGPGAGPAGRLTAARQVVTQRFQPPA